MNKEQFKKEVISIIDKYWPEDVVIPPKPTPPNPSVKKLTGYAWEDSDSHLHRGESYLMLPLWMTGRVKAVAINGVKFKYGLIWGNGRELWYGRGKSSFMQTAKRIVVTLNDGTIFADNVNETTGRNEWARLDKFAFTNGNRPTYRFTRPGKFYRGDLTVHIPGVFTKDIKFDGNRYDHGGLIVKHSTVKGVLTILYHSSCREKRCRVTY